ncbi:MAG: AmmeMemoRadiSam system radical SAM enzyme [Bacteroidetes bacterium CG23_combo_of_CG06-09_8_20_14_all_32_9]|nr:MAG: AmmeMemoRadiSam system radical SAM enzyme [Bacteroidetes bacterium CG23_combo_of_CG06-09_8_20_14_all_32_9]
MKTNLYSLQFADIKRNTINNQPEINLYSLSMLNKLKLHPALYWELTQDGIKCRLCPHECLIKKEKIGICKTRVNVENKLFTKAFGNICSISIDPIEKKPLFHFSPSSETFSIAIGGCTFRCLNCQNYSISQKDPESVEQYYLSPEQIVTKAIKNNCNSISYTYSEPVAFFEFMLETANIARSKGINNIMVSNGYINHKPLAELSQYLDAANIDLKTFDNTIYKKISGGSLQPVLDTLIMLHEKGVWLEITYLIIPEWSDNLNSIREMCNWLFANNFSDVPLHFSRFFPTYKLDDLPPTPVEILVKAMEIAKQEGIKYVYFGNVREQNGENTYCYNCKELLIKRTGFNVLENHISNGKCNYCNSIVPGMW